MQIKRLEVFDAIMRSGTVSAAARELGMTQSAVSRILARLEEELGFPLFYRERGTLIPAPRSSDMLSRVRSVLDAVSSIRELQNESNNPIRGKLNFVTVPSLSFSFVPEVLKAFYEQKPETRVRYDVRTTSASINAVISQEADFALLTLPASHPTLIVTPLFRTKSSAVMHKDHPLAKKERITAADLADENLIVLSVRQPTRIQLDEAFNRAGVKQKIAIETASVVSACKCAEQRIGVAVVNSLMACYAEADDLCIRPFDSLIHHTLALVEPAGKKRTPEMDVFFSCFVNNIEEVSQRHGIEIEVLHPGYSVSEYN
ncbi:LysR family transcriptional regulator [Rhodobacteraceae bacterium RKSG542]|uniref:LysR family transcriptional regulator n=1 Tax=Pseudovibrio flavus TaxID=2529854 RepID=UPI0012BBED83|nr:LysR family transcriptional regulator [Pseudovibrio flavus]MTI17442.1 LysR family transcriptional regulator [Pseudovibrio flavus]